MIQWPECSFIVIYYLFQWCEWFIVNYLNAVCQILGALCLGFVTEQLYILPTQSSAHLHLVLATHFF